MACLVWLIVWAVSSTPNVEMFGPWNSWGVALGICVLVDLLGGGSRVEVTRPWR